MEIKKRVNLRTSLQVQTVQNKIFQRSCAGCHATDLSGATGPDLRKVGGKYDAADIEEIIKKGRGSMSPGLIQGEDAKKVAEWLAEHK